MRIYRVIHMYHILLREVFLIRFSNNSETFASELLKNLEDMFLVTYNGEWWSHDRRNIVTTNIRFQRVFKVQFQYHATSLQSPSSQQATNISVVEIIDYRHRYVSEVNSSEFPLYFISMYYNQYVITIFQC